MAPAALTRSNALLRPVDPSRANWRGHRAASENLSIYSASKAAVIALTKSAGKELATSGVLVNVIAPAVIATPMNDDTAPEVLAHITSLIPMKRVGRAVDVAALVAWLSSDEVSFSTGAVYDISGGRATY